MPKLSGVLPVACTGAPGAYSETAARRYFGASTPTLTFESMRETLEALVGDRAQRAFVPVENSVTGHFDRVVDRLFEFDVHIVGEIVIPIRHCLLALPGAGLGDLSVVTSHPSALAQCRDWLVNWGVATRPADNTAIAARELAEHRDAALGVLGSRVLAELYGLEVLAEGLSDRSDNHTRFLILAPEPQTDETATRTSVLVGPVTAPRLLKTLRIQLEARDARRARAPFLGSQDGKRFLVEFDHDPGAGLDMAKAACDEFPFRWLGSWSPGV